MKQTLKVAYQYLVICIRIQALQNRPKETQKAIDPQRANIKEAIEHFSEIFDVKPPGITLVISNRGIVFRLPYWEVLVTVVSQSVLLIKLCEL